ncbi:MAG TPA: MFS transporter [Bryobacteraceae bacterium]|nr:MFS transporter [Bryobacteraceae bacterium]
MPRLRWLMISFAFLATVINYLDRQTLSVAAPVLREEFAMSAGDYSRVVFAFLLAYTILNGVSGALLDRLGTRVGYAICMAWWSAAAALHTLATGAWSLGAFRFLLGMGEAGNWPAAVKVVAEWFPERERALASGIFNSGSAVGAILAPPLVAWLILQFGWRTSFLAVAVLGFLWLAAWWPVYRSPGLTQPESRAAASGTSFSLLDLFRTRFVWSFTLSKVFIDPVWYFYIFWFPEYLKTARGFDMASIGRYAWIPFAVAGLGNLIGGWLSGWLIGLGLPVMNARRTAVTIFALLVTSAIPAVLVTNMRVAMGLVSLAMLGYTGASASMLAMPADVFPKNAVASVYGLASMGSGFGGMLFTLLTGWAVDHFSYTPVFIGFGILPLICAATLWALLSASTSPEGDRPTLL